MDILGRYKNGNYTVTIFDDGTKIRYNDENFFEAEFPESMDIKITNQCDIGCAYCHEDARLDGKHGDILNAKFIDTLHPYTELAIGGGDPLSHPDLFLFLKKCKELKLIPSITIHQKHFMQYFDVVKNLYDSKLIYGLGVSLKIIDDEFLDRISTIPNAVIHVIAGILDTYTLRRLYDKNLKLLILGYKKFRRGERYHRDKHTNMLNNLKSLSSKIQEIIPRFKVVSFDNLAIQQLDIQSILTKEEWSKFYMGDDGEFTMYVDLVKNEFAKNSTAIRRYQILDDVKSMFNVIQCS